MPRTVKTVSGTVNAYGKPAVDVLVSQRSINMLKKMPDSMQWLAFMHAGYVVVVGRYAGIYDVAEARVKGLWC